ncbi:MAG TPA: DUF255 domain-containing protein [Edaphocola sp.]|nr:DUF255 domain-containing protein [Edaphocola sp.]
MKFKNWKVLGMILLSALMLSITSNAQKNKKTVAVSDEIQWLSLSELEQKIKKEPRMIIFDFYTTWCGWCKVMDKKTYSNKELANYVNKNFYAVKFNAESKEALDFMGKHFEFKPEYKSHMFAVELMNGQMSYPTTVFVSPDFKMINPVPGYLRIDQMEGIMKFFIDGYPKKKEWNDFQKEFKAQWKPEPGSE